MEVNTSERRDRFAMQYAVALLLADKLIDSGILEKKLKITVKNVDDIRSSLLRALAVDLREAQKPGASLSLSLHDNLMITDAYLYELSVRGSEWEFADLQPGFLRWREALLSSIEGES